MSGRVIQLNESRKVIVYSKPKAKGKKSSLFEVPMVNGSAISQTNPLRSISGACHPDQVQEFNEYYRKSGVIGGYHEADGTLVLESRQARNGVMKARGIADNDAGYGDHSGDNR